VRVVSDTSPISYLLLIGESELLPALYDQLFIPMAVAAELRHPGGERMTACYDRVGGLK
jgi:predicted nucleic acid-binding protein